ncbi:predicted protein [Histoplasma mississippiense (nom. inval.)]|uniref:predicted protein n=1 Tax=Ajellomyces capsulatus (strain NAm1 / WU24) TaxID=2059318 RepID=UPI000157BE88|nr:predicted protein [Histoplasma mississippiense (nom. inval.)]EDN06715.1 predicted protein [Histoplasma mississippiense (nom. inval.)]
MATQYPAQQTLISYLSSHIISRTPTPHNAAKEKLILSEIRKGLQRWVVPSQALMAGGDISTVHSIQS